MDSERRTSWITCRGLCGYWLPVGRTYCCHACADAVDGDYVLDSHTPGCVERQAQRDKDMTAREELTEIDGRN